MERISPPARLGVLIGVLVADLAALPLLRWQLIRLGSKSELFRQPEIWIMISKCGLDSALVSLMALETSKGIGSERSGLAVDLLLRLSITCVSILEFLLTRRIFPSVKIRHFGRWWRDLGFVAIFFFTLLKVLPFISLHKDALHSWTVFSACLLEFFLFSLIYWWAFYIDHREWTVGRLAIPMSYSAAVLVASVFLILQWKLASIRHLLLASFLLFITYHFLMRSVYVEYVLGRARPECDKRVPNWPSHQWAHPLGNNVNCRKPSASTFGNRDTANSKELYASCLTVSDMIKDKGTPREEKESTGGIDPADIANGNSSTLELVSAQNIPPQSSTSTSERPISDDIRRSAELSTFSVHSFDPGQGSTARETPPSPYSPECESLNTEKDGQMEEATIEVDPRLVLPEQDTRLEWERIKVRRAEEEQKKIDKGERVKQLRCCRCKEPTTFPEGRCCGKFCQHERCPRCDDRLKVFKRSSITDNSPVRMKDLRQALHY